MQKRKLIALFKVLFYNLPPLPNHQPLGKQKQKHQGGLKLEVISGRS